VVLKRNSSLERPSDLQLAMNIEQTNKKKIQEGKKRTSTTLMIELVPAKQKHIISKAGHGVIRQRA
jgi:hypothetical protein